MTKTNKIDEIKKLLGTKRLIIGVDRTMKGLRKGGLVRIYFSSNVSKKVKEDIEYYAKLGKLEIISLNKSNIELGSFCKKPFQISVLSIAKE